MVLLNSAKKDLGTQAPEFTLQGVDGNTYSLKSFESSKVLVIMFICNHCPYVQAIEDRIIQLQRYFEDKSVQLVGICSNDSTDYPNDSPENLKKSWKEKDYRFPYLVDETQEVARAYGAVCTPDIFVYNEARELAYHGQLDDNWKEPENVTSEDLKNAISKLLVGETLSSKQSPSLGCSIKWKQS